MRALCQDCPDEAALEDTVTGMQIEQILEIQDLSKLYEEEYIRLRAVIHGLLPNARKATINYDKGSTQLLAPSKASDIGRTLKHDVGLEATAGWFDASAVSFALVEWKERTVLNDKGNFVAFTYFLSLFSCRLIISFSSHVF